MNDPDKEFKEAIQKLRKIEGLCPMTDEEADAAYDAAPAETMSKKKIHSIVDLVTSGELASWDPVEEPEWDKDIDVSDVEHGIAFMHRNEGESDEVSDAEEDDLREELLSDQDEEQTGMDEGESTTGAGG